MATGLIQNALGTSGLTQTDTPAPVTTTEANANTTQPAATTTYTPTKLPDPTTWTTTPDQTVAGQIVKNTDPNSPLIAQARNRALQVANDKGLMNSSIAMTAADSAAYDVALPIAQADAANASKVAGYNADQKNQFAVKDQDTATQVGLNNSAQSNQMAIANLNQQTQLKIKQLDQAQQSELSAIENQNRALIQNSQVASSAYSTYANTLYNNSVNTNMDAAARYAANLSAFHLYQQQISLAAVLTGVPDVSNQLIFTQVAPGAAPVTPTPGQIGTPTPVVPAGTNSGTNTPLPLNPTPVTPAPYWESPQIG